jgi:hypothetical protein
VPDDQFQFDAERNAEWHAELIALITVLLGQFVAFEPQFGRQHGPAVAFVLGEPGVALALVVGELRSAVVFRQPRRIRATPTAAATRLADASVRWRFAGQHDFIVRITGRWWCGRGRARHPGRFDTQWRPDGHHWPDRRLDRFGGQRRPAWCGRPTGVHERRIRRTGRFGGHRWRARPARLCEPDRQRRPGTDARQRGLRWQYGWSANRGQHQRRFGRRWRQWSHDR